MVRNRLAALLVASACGGCIPLFPFTKAPYPKELLDTLSRGADRESVRRALGSPQATKAGGTYWFYAHQRPMVGFLIASSGNVWTRFEWVAVRFDASGRADFIGYSDDVTGCLANGVCNRSGRIEHEPALAVLTAPTDRDGGAKSYRVSAHECAVYFYHEPAGFKVPAAPPAVLSVDGRVHGVSDYDTYLFLTHPAGTVRLAAYQFQIAPDCRAGEKLYVKGMGTWRSYDPGKSLAPVDAAEGERAIRARLLALPN
jgi:outer membrane protein assembly factor BamE (lipoprotein component of BamABCDE complex)